MINDTINFFSAVSILLISSHNSFRVLFDKITSVYFILKLYVYTLALEMDSPGNQHCANCIGALSFPIAASAEFSLPRYAFAAQTPSLARKMTKFVPKDSTFYRFVLRCDYFT